ncbi:GNAT family N-acetyltransferase [Larsenimonas suaedae]|uniref:tRNA(Met) cytidine acetyltransferase TmcA n=1 Tax=Larsenimonas suaedae TaxID=1851019 RepID=A0ABU1GSN8_9GAMM|nr:GNAT family N-acetyltransferase [Larsenimonas suaedae]MCM2972354.1 GNAT family N-acetyltransferase [Larsenimonas suaedae]MDR5894850.1 GNAT family N-acetyltransferase [Larsenimonas suaedae]
MAQAEAMTRADVRTLQDKLRARRHRALLWWSGDFDALRARAWECLPDEGDVLWVGAPPETAAHVHSVTVKTARQWLGRETDMVVLEAFEGVEPDALGALSGTVRPGGVVLLLLDARTPTSRFDRRIRRLLAELPALPTDAVPTGPAGELPFDGPSYGAVTSDQVRAVEALLALKRRRPLVITADRGRGKSAALGLAAAELLRRGQTTLYVSAPRKASVAPLFARLEAQLPGGTLEGGVFRYHDQSVRFVPPDQLGEVGGPGTTLLIDEAAALPVQYLSTALERFPRIAFASTVHGYEGAGRGFELRFRARLDARTPDWRALELTTPIRWADGDPLEDATDRLLCLSARPTPLDPLATPAIPSLRVERLDRARLASDDAVLEAVFGLLVQAHYRTAPRDLVQLLDGEGVAVWAAFDGEVIVGVALSVDEGGFSEALARAVADGHRRPRGHLMAQSLALHLGLEAAAQCRHRRVMRVAVHEARRRLGVGARLIEALAAEGRRDGIDALAVSFGLDDHLPAFWAAQAFSVVRVGLGRETASGEHALMMLRPLTDDGQALTRQAHARLASLWAEWLGVELQTLPASQVAWVTAYLTPPALAPDDAALIDRFAHANAPWALSRASLRRWLWQTAFERPDEAGLSMALALSFQGLECAIEDEEVPEGREARIGWLRRWVSSRRG